MPCAPTQNLRVEIEKKNVMGIKLVEENNRYTKLIPLPGVSQSNTVLVCNYYKACLLSMCHTNHKEQLKSKHTFYQN